MAAMRALLSLCAVVLTIAACSGKSQDPPQGTAGNGDLSCLTTLASYCCPATERPSCVADFASAQVCGAWATPSKVTVHAAACDGLLAVTVAQPTYKQVYVFDGTTGALMAIGDDAATQTPGSLAIECGAGPSGFSVPTQCTSAWLDSTAGNGCRSGTATAASVCP